MSDVKPFTIISGGANGVDLEAERFARDLQYIKLSCSETSRNGASFYHLST